MAETRISFDFFYDSLSPHGDWSETDRYGRVWQPRGVDRDWSPYSDGYWSYTDAGWTWVSYEDFGGITYHYGRWVQLDEAGWCWVPGYEWGPAWVSWRNSDDYIGWAPLPPEARWEVRTGFSSWVDTHYDIGPGNYSFCNARDFGAPVIRHVIVPRSRNVTIINVTNNITNITYNRDNGYIFNGGLDYDYIAPRCSHSLPALKLVQNTTNNIFINNNKGNVFVNSQRGNALYVSAPPLADSNYNVLTRQTAPARVYKAPTNSRGWAGLDKDGVREKLLVKMRDEVKGATPDTAPARAFRPESIAAVPKKADPTAPRPSLLKASVKRGADRVVDGQPIPISGIKREDVGKENLRPAINPDVRPELPKQPFTRPQISTNTPEQDAKPEILKRPVTRPDADEREKDSPVRLAPVPNVLKKPRENVRETPARPIAKPDDDNELRRKLAEQTEREKSERAAQDARLRELEKQRDTDKDRQSVMEKQRRESEQSNARRESEESAKRKQAETTEQKRNAAEVEKLQRKLADTQRASEENARRQKAAEVDQQRRVEELQKMQRKQADAQRASEENSRKQQAAATEQQRRAADAEKMQRKQVESQRAAEENSRRQQSAVIEKQRRAEQDNARRAQEDNARRAAAESQQRMQQEQARRASDEARQRQAAEASRRAQVPQRPVAPPQRPSGGSSGRILTPEEQAALLKKKISR